MSIQSRVAPHTASTPQKINLGTRRGRRKIDFSIVLSFVWMALLVGAIALQTVLPLPEPSRINYAAIAAPPFSPGHILGTDETGRDILARLIAGAQVSLIVGLASTAFAVLIGAPLGILAGYFGGVTNRIISGVLDVMLAFPSIVALIALSVFVGPGMWTIIIGIGIVASPAVARVARSSALLFAKREFVTAARGMGAGNARILVKEILPNVVVPVMSYAIVLVAVAIVAEASLSFLGLGVPPPTASWGGMMGTGRAELSSNPHIVLIPAATMCLTLLSLNFLSEHFSKRFDIKEAAL